MKPDNPIICFDYYMTLVEMDSPFESLEGWMNDYLTIHHPEVAAKRFYSRFLRNRAVLGCGDKFLLGIDLLAESFKNTCKSFEAFCPQDEFVNFVEELFVSPKPYQDSMQVIEELRRGYRVGLLTNADNHILYQSIHNNGFQFDFIITSEDAKANKPDKRIFQYALDKLGAANDEIIMIGDSQSDDIYGAGQMNINTIWVNRKHEILREGIKPPVFEVDMLQDILYKISG